MNQALNGTDPVVFFESQRIYDKGEEFHKEGVPEGYYEVNIGEPDVKREGKDVTILSIGAVLYRALDAAKKLEKDYGISAEIIDARTLVPFDYSKVIESVKKTGKIVIVGDAVDRCSVMRDMASNIAEMAFDYLDAPPAVFGSRNWITPAFELEKYYFPQPDGIIDVIHEKLMPIPGYVPTYNETELEHMDRAKKGV
jgi:2-oxoisovalerate dehydrogenase E1 component